MSFSDWLILGGAALLIRNVMIKEAADREEAEEDYNRFMSDLETRQNELERSRSVNYKRRDMPCFFNDGLISSDFVEIAERAGRKIKRIKSVSIIGAVIYCNVESQTGYSDWDFSVDFNDWGHVTGTYWTQTDNDDSSIPHHFGHMVSGWIHDFYRERDISLRDLSDYVDNNKDLETPTGLNYIYKEKFLDRLFGNKNKSVTISYGTDDLIGEHLYPVISILKATGFKNIKTFSVKDINDRTPGYYYQVEQVLISGSGFFEYGMCFPENTEVLITYHEKQVIRMPYSEGELKRGNYVSVGDMLQELGFTQIYERKIEDLVTGWIVQEGSVERVLLNGEDEKPIVKNVSYEYDQKIVICYHTKKS